MGLAVVLPTCSVPAAPVSSRDAAARASEPRAWFGKVGIDTSVGLDCSDVTLMDDGVVKSVSAAVDDDRLLEDDGSFGAE